jgi:hypothetical protein
MAEECPIVRGVESWLPARWRTPPDPRSSARPAPAGPAALGPRTPRTCPCDCPLCHFAGGVVARFCLAPPPTSGNRMKAALAKRLVHAESVKLYTAATDLRLRSSSAPWDGQSGRIGAPHFGVAPRLRSRPSAPERAAFPTTQSVRDSAWRRRPLAGREAGSTRSDRSGVMRNPELRRRQRFDVYGTGAFRKPPAAMRWRT